MKKALFLLLSLLLLLPLTGCGLPEGVVTLEEAYYDGVQPGTTTVDALLELWGEPTEHEESGNMALYVYRDKGCTCFSFLADPEHRIWSMHISGAEAKGTFTRGIAPGAYLADILAQLPEDPHKRIPSSMKITAAQAGAQSYAVYGNPARWRDFCIITETASELTMELMVEDWLNVTLEMDKNEQVQTVILTDSKMRTYF